MKCRLFDLIPCYTKVVDEDFFDEHEIEGVTLEEYEKMSDSIYRSLKALKITDDDIIRVDKIYRFDRFNDEDLFAALIMNDDIVALHKVDTSEIEYYDVTIDANSKIAMPDIYELREAKLNELKLAYVIQYVVDAYKANNYVAVFDHSYICVSLPVEDERMRNTILVEVEPGNEQQYNEAIEKLRRIKNQFTQRKLVLTEYYREF